MVISSRLVLVHRFFSGTGASYDLVVRLCTIGLDVWWKKKILKKIPPEAKRIIDQASGTGILTFEIARRFPLAHVSGVEVRKEYLDISREKARIHGVTNVDFHLGRAEDVVLAGTFDCITSSYLAKYAELETLVKRAREMLRNDGLLIMHDFIYPTGRLFSVLWKFYFALLQNVGSRINSRWKTVFYELPDLLRKSEWTDRLTKHLEENGFRDIQTETFIFRTSAVISARSRKVPVDRGPEHNSPSGKVVDTFQLTGGQPNPNPTSST